ncbi:glutaredoxin family protein [Actomonas aquatica]|uniref:Glutaredoxin family protein n=1 Tax=Actomonas aquatica TaxID=2866162 RepID=A0ABZ1C3J7_9BACT|nr:glutaredoxin family protein [Opitutus sp. WL0086]WRQ86293.1 glutaredoxin family protein [Opitutus sp. WL0086]
MTPVLYTKSGCPWCAEARRVLDDAQVSYHERNVSGDPAAFEDMRRLSGQTFAPVLDWEGKILSDFGAVELVPFLVSCGIPLAA